MQPNYFTVTPKSNQSTTRIKTLAVFLPAGVFYIRKTAKKN